MALKILWASPLPPIRSGVSDYAVEFLRPLCRIASIRVVEPPGISCELPDDLEVEVVASDTAPGPDELTVVHLGNNPYHEWLVDRCPDAVVVVHDIVLHHLLVEVCANPASKRRLSIELEEVHGPEGRALADARAFGLRGRLDPFLFPATATFLRDAKALVAHSEWGRRALNQAVPDVPTAWIRLPVADPGPVDRTAVRDKLGLQPHEKAIMHLGFLTREKGLEVVLSGLAAAVGLGHEARLFLVGEPDPTGVLHKAADKIGIGDRVVETGWVPWHTMVEMPAAADLGFALRAPSAGETSAAVLRFLACGTPVAVNGRRQFLEWPASVAPRVTPGPSAVAEVLRLITRCGDAEARCKARAMYEKNHRPEDSATRLASFLTQL